MTALTADICARAVIASARVYRDDPIKACTATTGKIRRSLAPAVLALSGVLNLPRPRVAKVFGVSSWTVNQAAASPSPRFIEAQAAAEGAVLAWSEPLAPEPPAPSPPPAGVELPPPQVRVKPPSGPLALPAAKALGRVKREVLATLADEPSSGPELMQLVGVGEGQIREALSALKTEGRVACTAMTQEGWPAQFWRLAEGDRP